MPQFNPSWGSLDSVRIEITYQTVINALVSNGGNGSAGFWFSTESELDATLPQYLGILAVQASTPSEHISLGKGGTGFYGPYSETNVVDLVLTGPAVKSFIGMANVVIPVETSTWVTIGVENGKVLDTLSARSTATVTVEYEDSAVPEPGAGWILAAGLAWLVWQRRARTPTIRC